MTTPGYYRAQARLLFIWARQCTDPEMADRLNARAEEYLVMAEAIEESALPAATSGSYANAPYVR